MSNRKLPRRENLASITGYERRLVGCILINPTVFAQIELTISPADFLDDGLGAMYRAMLILSNSGRLFPDTRWIHRELFKLGVPEELCLECNLLKIAEEAVNESGVVFYAEEIAKAAEIRRLQLVAADFQKRAGEADANPIALRHFVESRLAGLDRAQPHELRTIYEVAGDAISAVDIAGESPTEPGLMSGIERLDSSAGATMPGELLVIGARPGKGKTSAATQIGIHNAERGRQVAMVSLEMRGTEIALRMLCGRAEIDSRPVRSCRPNEQTRRKLQSERETLKGLPFRMWSPPSATLADIRGLGRYAKATTGLQLLIVDYIQLVKPSADEKWLKRHEQIGAVTAGLKVLAKELEIVVLANAQLSREADDSEPALSHLRESGSIEQDSDAVWLIHHPPVSGLATNEEVWAKGCQVIIAKHRHGETGRVSLLWHPKETRFSSPPSF